MKNKKITLKLGFLAAVVGCFSLSFTSATVFRLNIDKIESLSEVYLSDKIIPIHFADNGNDFGGFFYFSNGLIEETTGEEDPGGETDPEITTGYYVTIDNNDLPGRTETYECDRQIKGFYYNAERGERLWPLDQETWASIGVDTTGGFYTMCQKEGYKEALSGCLNRASLPGGEDFESCKKAVRISFATDGDGYYGYIKHTYSGQEMALIAGVNYNPESYSKFIPISSGGGFSPSFVRISNKYPVGFVYDYNGGVGLVGCRVTPGGTIKNIITVYNSSAISHDLNKMFSEIGGELHYDGGDADCSNAVWDPLIGVVIEGVVGMGEMGNDNKFGVIGNQMNQKMQYFSSADINNNTIINYARKKAELLCRGKWKSGGSLSTNGDVLCVDTTDVNYLISKSTKQKGQTLIVKNGDVTIRPFNNNEEGYYDIFIDSGNLIIEEPDSTQKFVFDKNGFPTSYGTEQFSTDVNTAGEYTGDYAAIGSFIRGNFIVNGNIKSAGGSGLQNKYFMHGKISTRDDFDTLLDTFKWRCNYGNATDGTYCPMSIRGKWENPYDNASLVIIDQNYDSPFFND